MKCDEVRQSFEAYLVGKLNSQSKRDLEDHLESCPACAELILVEDPVLDSLLASDWYLGPSPDLTERVLRGVNRGAVSTRVWVLLGLGAYLTVWLCGGVLLLFAPRLGSATHLLRYVLTAGKSVVLAIRLTVSAMAFYHLSSLGMALTFGLAACIFASMGLISKEELA